MTSREEARAKIVEALNLTPLVPPQADDKTMDVVNEAWAALSYLMTGETLDESAVRTMRALEKRASDAEDKIAELSADLVIAQAALKCIPEEPLDEWPFSVRLMVSNISRNAMRRLEEKKG